MKKLVGFLLSILILSCTPKKIITDDAKYGVMINEMNGVYSVVQFDSMCVADALPKDFSKWETIFIVDYETKEKYTLYLYVKEYGMSESVYKVESVSQDSIKIIKRVISE